jgi:hypothetical protein
MAPSNDLGGTRPHCYSALPTPRCDHEEARSLDPACRRRLRGRLRRGSGVAERVISGVHGGRHQSPRLIS